MILKNNFNKDNVDYVKESRDSIRRGVDNLDKRYQNHELSIDSVKKIADTYAKRQESINKEEKKKRF